MAQTRRTVSAARPVRPYAYGYVQGNTVRKLEPSPYERRELEERRRYEQERRRARMEKERREHHEIAERNRSKVIKMDLRYTFFLAMAVAATLLICIYYLSLQSQMTTQNKTISILKSELNTLVDENLATQERISNAIDLEEVYAIATADMGMSYASKSQIVYYSDTAQDYVKQYKEIPLARR